MTGNNPFGRSSFLRALSHELDPPKSKRDLAKHRYEDLGRFLRTHADCAYDVEVYPQGSRNLGTTNQDPYTGEFDIDLVVRLDCGKGPMSQVELNTLVGGWLKEYTSQIRLHDMTLNPTRLEPGKRAWTLYYSDRFHMDVLPVIVDKDDELSPQLGDPSWLTDKELRFWQGTNPRGFAEWFREVSQFHEIKKALASERAVTVDGLPDDEVKTDLQILVQLLKRHRDHWFATEGSDRKSQCPPSAVITALAAKAYDTLGAVSLSLDEAIEVVVPEMLKLAGRRQNGELWVPNPRCHQENYADRYKGEPNKVRALQDWLQGAIETFGRVLTAHQADRVTKSIDSGFGEGLGIRASKRVGTDAQQLRELGMVASAAGTGRLHIDPSSANRPHDFYGDPTS